MTRSPSYKKCLLVHARRCARDLIDYGFESLFGLDVVGAVSEYNDKLWEFVELSANRNGLNCDPKIVKAQVSAAHAAYKAARDKLDLVLMVD